MSIRLFSVDLFAIQAEALQEGTPCQAPIAGVLHKYMTSKLAEKGGFVVQQAAAPTSSFDQTVCGRLLSPTWRGAVSFNPSKA